ncbi:hypothetical protein BGW80DRAFT_1312988 [Lactifluus volemus]|nr:hypothetical protein BGW80DRAFT_1312988 [Lactifluus volemus]
MKSILFSVLSVTFFVTLKGVAGVLTADTPANVAECEPVQLTFEGGTRFLTSGANPNGPALVTFAQTDHSPILYTVAFPPLDFVVRDSAGAIGQSAPLLFWLVVLSTACVGASGSSVAAGTTAASPAAGSSAAATSGTTPAATNGNKLTTSASASTSTTSAKSSSNAASVAGEISYGVAGVIGAVVAAVLA